MRRLHVINFIGVLTLAGLCVLQWKQNRDLNLQFNQIQKINFDQTAQKRALESNLKGTTADLSELKTRIADARKADGATQRKLNQARAEVRQLSTERDQLRTSVTNWSAAVAARDERLKQANSEIKNLSQELNSARLQYNELASNHNSLVTNWNAVMKDLNARSIKPSLNEK